MKRVLRTPVLFVILTIASQCGARAIAAIGDVYDLYDDFSFTANPNTTALGGTWSFHDDDDEELLLEAEFPIGFVSGPGWDLLGGGGVPAIWQNGATALITTLPFDPSRVGNHGGNLLIRWVSPEAGFARVSGYYFQDDRHPPPNRIMHYVLEKNGVEIDSQVVVTTSTELEFDEVIPIMLGDTIDMRLLGNGPGATTPFGDFGGIVQRIEIVEAPPTGPGDFDFDGDVDGNDFLVLQRGLGETHDAGDLADFKANFGAGGATAAQQSVPEPGAGALAVLAACCLFMKSSRTRL